MTTRQVQRALARLRKEWRGWTTGAYVPHGAPWCEHRRPDPACEGCATRQWTRDRAHELEHQAAALQCPDCARLIERYQPGWRCWQHNETTASTDDAEK